MTAFEVEMPRTETSADIPTLGRLAARVATLSSKTKSTVELAPVWTTSPAPRILPAVNGCQTLSAEEYLAMPEMRTTVTTPCLTDCADAPTVNAMTTAQTTVERKN